MIAVHGSRINYSCQSVGFVFHTWPVFFCVPNIAPPKSHPNRLIQRSRGRSIRFDDSNRDKHEETQTVEIHHLRFEKKKYNKMSTNVDLDNFDWFIMVEQNQKRLLYTAYYSVVDSTKIALGTLNKKKSLEQKKSWEPSPDRAKQNNTSWV